MSVIAIYSYLFFENLTLVRYSILNLCFEIIHWDQGSETLQALRAAAFIPAAGLLR